MINVKRGLLVIQNNQKGGFAAAELLKIYSNAYQGTTELLMKAWYDPRAQHASKSLCN